MPEVSRVIVSVVGNGTGGTSNDPTKLPRNGSAAMLANLPFGGFKGENLADGTSAMDAVNVRQLNAKVAGLSIDDLLPSFTITGFAPTVSVLVERGTTVSNIGAAASYSRTPASAAVSEALGGSVGGDVLSGEWAAMTTPFTSASRSGSVARSGTDLGANPTLTATLTASNGPTRTASWTITWASRQYWGVGAAGGLSGAQITSLTSSISATKLTSFTVSPSSQKVYFAIPKQLGTVVMSLAGFEAAFNSPTEVAVTSNGVTRTYYLYESTYLLTGTGLVFTIA